MVASDIGIARSDAFKEENRPYCGSWSTHSAANINPHSRELPLFVPPYQDIVVSDCLSPFFWNRHSEAETLRHDLDADFGHDGIHMNKSSRATKESAVSVSELVSLIVLGFFWA